MLFDLDDSLYTPEPTSRPSNLLNYEIPIGTRVTIRSVSSDRLVINTPLKGIVYGYTNFPLETNPEYYSIFTESGLVPEGTREWISIPRFYIPFLELSVQGDECLWKVDE